MMRTLNFVCLAMTGLVCLGLYNLAEQARVAQVELRATQSAIKRERDTLTVFGAEWARLTQPNRISVLAKKHLALQDRPTLRLSSLTQLPAKALPLPQEGQILTAKAILRVTPQQKPRPAAFQVPSAPAPKPVTTVAFQTPAPAPKPAATAAAFETPAASASKPHTAVAYEISAGSAVAVKLRAVTAATVSIAPLPSVRTVAFTPTAGH
jgi:hypothetical protein